MPSRWVPPCLVGVKAGRVHLCFGWQVTLCDPVWQMTLRSSEMGFCTLNLFCTLVHNGVVGHEDTICQQT